MKTLFCLALSISAAASAASSSESVAMVGGHWCNGSCVQVGKNEIGDSYSLRGRIPIRKVTNITTWETHAVVPLVSTPDPSSACQPRGIFAAGDYAFVQTLAGSTSLIMVVNGMPVTKTLAPPNPDQTWRQTMPLASNPPLGVQDFDYFVMLVDTDPTANVNQGKKIDKAYRVEAFPPLSTPLSDCDKERPDQLGSLIYKLGRTKREPGTGQGGEPIH